MIKPQPISPFTASISPLNRNPNSAENGDSIEKMMAASLGGSLRCAHTCTPNPKAVAASPVKAATPNTDNGIEAGKASVKNDITPVKTAKQADWMSALNRQSASRGNFSTATT